jgi:hypothetical protein
MLDDDNNYNNKSSISLQSTLKYYEIARAQDKEDIYALENWYWNYQNGVILESGALNGIEFSTSLMFEKYLNWKTIHIEASPDSFHQLKNNRPNSINIHAALCNQTKTLHFLNNRGNLAVSGIYEYLKESFIEMWHAEFYKKFKEGKIRIEDLPTIACVKLEALLKVLNIYHIDIWVLDVEGIIIIIILIIILIVTIQGAEFDIIKSSIDFNKININTIIIECEGRQGDNDAGLIQYMDNVNYNCIKEKRNCFCTKKTFIKHQKPVELKSFYHFT